MAGAFDISHQQASTLLPEFNNDLLTNFEFGNYYGGSTVASNVADSSASSAINSTALLLGIGVAAYLLLRNRGK